MNKYVVKGEYGIQEGELIVREMRAKNVENVRRNFLVYVRKNAPHLVSKIRSNIYIQEIR